MADVFFKAGFIEAWGRGTLKIVDKCREKKLPEPEFSEMTGGFLVIFSKSKAVGKVTDGVTKKVTERVTENQGVILSKMRENSYITVKELSAIVKISERKIKENIKKLKKYKMVKRIGSAKGGHWEVL